MRTMWIDKATYERVTSAWDAAQDTPRDAGAGALEVVR